MRIAIIFFIAVIASANAASAQPVNWSGGYVGASLGAAWADVGVSTELLDFWNAPAEQLDRDALLPMLNRGLNGAGVTGGLALGYNLQQSGLVYGVEVDISALDVSEKSTAFNVPGSPFPPWPYRADTTAQIDWLATFRGRLGWAFDRSLIYVTGGLAVGRYEFTQDITQLQLPAFPGLVSFEQRAAIRTTASGWVLGGGVEHALFENWSLKLQYLHVDMGSRSAQSAGHCDGFPGCEGYAGRHKVDMKLDMVTAGINYRF